MTSSSSALLRGTRRQCSLYHYGGPTQTSGAGRSVPSLWCNASARAVTHGIADHSCGARLVPHLLGERSDDAWRAQPLFRPAHPELAENEVQRRSAVQAVVAEVSPAQLWIRAAGFHSVCLFSLFFRRRWRRMQIGCCSEVRGTVLDASVRLGIACAFNLWTVAGAREQRRATSYHCSRHFFGSVGIAAGVSEGTSCAAG